VANGAATLDEYHNFVNKTSNGNYIFGDDLEDDALDGGKVSAFSPKISESKTADLTFQPHTDYSWIARQLDSGTSS